MKVRELIGLLEKLSQDEEVGYVWDGEVRSKVAFVWQSKSNGVVLSGEGEVLYSEGSRPIDAPTEAQEKYWECQTL